MILSVDDVARRSVMRKELNCVCLEEACGSSMREMGPTEEIVPSYSTQEGGPGWVACTGMEKCELLHCSCEIIDIACSGLGNRGRPVLWGCDCVM